MKCWRESYFSFIVMAPAGALNITRKRISCRSSCAWGHQRQLNTIPKELTDRLAHILFFYNNWSCWCTWQINCKRKKNVVRTVSSLITFPFSSSTIGWSCALQGLSTWQTNQSYERKRKESYVREVWFFLFHLLHSFSWLLSPAGDQEKEANEEKITSLTMPTLMKKEKHCPQEPLIFFRRWTITSQWFQRGRFSSS